MSTLYTPELIQELKSITSNLSRPDGVKAVGRRLKLSERASRAAYAKYVAQGAEAATTAVKPTASSYGQEGREEPPKTRGASISISGDVSEVTLTDDNPRTLDELLKACEVDLNVWEVEKSVVNKWEVAMREPATTRGGRGGDAELTDSGNPIWTRKSHIPIRVPLYQIKAWLRRKVEASTLNKMLESFIASANKHAPKRFEFVKPLRGKADCCYVLNIQDLHVAKLACSEETGGANWDIRIAEQTFREAVEDLMAKAPVDRIEEVVVIAGSDMIQVDNQQSSTTAGTYVDSDTRLFKAFDVTSKMLTDVIEKLAARFKVKVIAIAGNHDSSTSFFVGKYVDAWFRNHPNVEVDSSPRSRKYYGYGETLVALDHGNNTKLKDLPLTVMRENQSTISKYRFTEVLTGHRHIEASEDIKGIIVRTAPALCPPDNWHSVHGYVGTIRRSQGLLYRRQGGLECIYYSKSLD